MMDEESYDEVLDTIQTHCTSRDPRLLRLASVTSSILEIEPTKNRSAKHVYATACKTLEATLAIGEAKQQLDAHLTQCALLELLSVTFAHIEKSALKATFPVVSRILRAIVFSCQEAQAVFDTKDDLSSLTSILRSACRCSCEFLRSIPPQASPDEVSSLLHGTLLTLFGHPKRKVAQVAQESTCELLMMSSPACHKAIRKDVMKMVDSEIKSFTVGSAGSKGNTLAPTLEFLNTAVAFMDMAKIGSTLMEKAATGLSELRDMGMQTVFVKATKHDAQARFEAIVALLSTVQRILQIEELSPKQQRIMGEFGARVLATLLQAQPGLSGPHVALAVEDSVANHILHGDLVLTACQQLLRYGDAKTARGLLPLAIRLVLKLSACHADTDESEIAAKLAPQLTEVFRVELASFRTKEPGMFDEMVAKCIPIMETVLDANSRHTWDSTVQTLVHFVTMLYDEYPSQLSSTLSKLFHERTTLAGDEKPTDVLDQAICSLADSIGIESFWTIIFPAGRTAATDNWWVLTVLRQRGASLQTTPTHLAFFLQSILPLARQNDMIASKAAQPLPLYQRRVEDLWASFPTICDHASDVEGELSKIVPILLRAVNDRRYPVILRFICKGLVSLASQSNAEQVEQTGFSEAFDKQCSTLLPSLFKLVGTLHREEYEGKNHSGSYQDIEQVAATISSLAQVASTDTVRALFKRLLQKLVKANQNAGNPTQTGEVLSLLCLAEALVLSKSLDSDDVALLYRCIKPMIRTDETHPRVQKRSYKVLGALCKANSNFLLEADRLKDLCDILTVASATSQISARHMRLKCLGSLVENMDANNSSHTAALSHFLSEVILCLKDFNRKTRDTAYSVLMTMVEHTNDLPGFIKSVCASLGAESPHMRSAGLTAISRIIFEKSQEDETIQMLLPSLLQIVLILFNDAAREVVKSVVGFVRVTVVAMPRDALEPLLPELVPSLLMFNRGKDRFRSKIKIILKRLVKLFGYEKLFPLVSDGDSRLLTHMRKLSEREARRKKRNKEGSRQDEARDFDDLLDSDEEDSDGGITLATGFTRRTGATMSSRFSTASKSLASVQRRGKRSRSDATAATGRGAKSSLLRVKNDSKGDAYDISNLTKKTVRFDDNMDDGSDSDDGCLQFNASGKLVVRESPETAQTDRSNGTQTSQSKAGNISRFEEAKRRNSTAARASKKQQQRQKQVSALGAAYKSKKSGGDVRKKGQKFEPYAFVPLDGKRYTKHNRKSTVEEMSTVVTRRAKRQKRS